MTSRPTPARARGFSLVELSIVMTIIGLLATVAMTEFTNFLSRSKRAEVYANLRAIGRLELMYEQDAHAFSPYPQLIGFAPERANRYAYIFKDGCPSMQDRSTVVLTTTGTQTCIGIDTMVFPGASSYPTTVTEDATETEVMVSAVGNLDPDGSVDQWSLSSDGRSEGAVSSDVSCASFDTPPYDPCLDESDT